MKSGSAGCRNTSSARFHIHTTLQLSINLSYVGLTDKYMNFQELNLPNALLRALRDKEYERPTPIQMQAIPAALEGRDILGTAQTGTGKTAAFALPVLANLLRRPPVGRGRPIRALILTPTRELALQIDESLGDYAKYTPLRTCVVFGGVNQRPQIDCLKRGVDVLTGYAGASARLDRAGAYLVEADRIFRT